jgi:hypothetical protein
MVQLRSRLRLPHRGRPGRGGHVGGREPCAPAALRAVFVSEAEGVVSSGGASINGEPVMTTNEPAVGTSSLPPDQSNGAKQTWCFWSTHESIQNELPSVMAILETIITVPLYWWVALRVGVVLPLLISAAVAPMVLLRSDDSVALGVKWFMKADWGALNRFAGFPNESFIWSIIGLTSFTIVLTTTFFFSPHTFIFNLYLIIAMYILFSILTINAVVYAFFGYAFFRSNNLKVRRLLIAFPYGLAVFITSLIIRLIASLVHLHSGLIALPTNFRRLVICTSPLQAPELVPGLENTNSEFRFAAFLMNVRHGPYDEKLTKPLAGILFIPAWAYRLTIKSTAWFWWPLAFLGGDLKRTQNPALFRWEVMDSLWAKTSIALACLSLIAFAVAHFGTLVFGENDFLIPAGRLLAIDWSSLWSWQVFALTAAVLSLALVFLVNDVSGRYRIAQEHGDTQLLAAAQMRFGWIERLARVRLLVLLAFWGLVGTHALLYVNSQQCWFSLSPELQSIANSVYGDRLPRSDKCLGAH